MTIKSADLLNTLDTLKAALIYVRISDDAPALERSLEEAIELLNTILKGTNNETK